MKKALSLPRPKADPQPGPPARSGAAGCGREQSWKAWTRTSPSSAWSCPCSFVGRWLAHKIAENMMGTIRRVTRNPHEVRAGDAIWMRPLT
jgi:hypothetical protein